MSLDFNNDMTTTNKKKVIYSPSTPISKKNKGKDSSNLLKDKQEEEDTKNDLNILLIDNYDSYTYNLYQYLSTINYNYNTTASFERKAKPPLVVANDAYATWEELYAHVTQDYFDGEDIDCIVISPGPGRPECADDMGICLQAIEQSPEIPILGVCLGHQALGYYYNASIILSPDGPIHGQLSGVHYNENFGDDDSKQQTKEEVKCDLFRDIPQNFDVVRYHSLAVQFPSNKKECKDLEIEPIAWCDTLPPLNKETEKVCMALQHKKYPHYGVQFHPESIGAGENGYKILENFCDFVKEYWKSHDRPTNKGNQNEDLQNFSFESAKTIAAAKTIATKTTVSGEKNKEAASNKNTQSRYNVLIHKIPTDKTTSVIPEQVYETFYATAQSNSFWLDSSTGCLPSSFVSPDNECVIQSNSRFSIMGGNDGPLSRRIEYYGEDFPVEDRGIRVVTSESSNSDTVEETKVEGDILSYLREQIINKNEIVDHVDLVNFESDTEEKVSLDRLHEFPQEGTAQSSSKTAASLPFEYRGGYVGFLGYEVRHDTRRHIMEQEKQQTGDETKGCEDNHSGEEKHTSIESRNKERFVVRKNRNIPTAAFLFADRSVLYDHWMDEWYLIGVSSNEGNFAQTTTTINGEREKYVEKDDVISWMQQMSEDISNLSSSSSSSVVKEYENDKRTDNSIISENDSYNAIASMPAEDRIHFTPNRSKQQYQADITRCHEEIKNGESYELCVTNQLETVIKIPPSPSRQQFRLNREEENDILKRQPERGGGSSASHLSAQDKTNGIEKTPFGLYKILRKRNPAPFAAFFKLEGNEKEPKESENKKSNDASLSANVSICCSSPERFLSVTKLSGFTGTDEGYTQPWYSGHDASLSSPLSSKYYQVESKPIKGTAARHFISKQIQSNESTRTGVKSSTLPPKEEDSEKEDEKIADELRTSVKNRAENLMIVDLLRNDLSRVCEIGSVHVPRLMHIESFATVHQMVSTIRGVIESNENNPKNAKNAIDLMSACFPGGSMTGAPKLRTMDIIDEMEEGVSRGPYSGSLGYLSLNGCMDMNIVIRTAVLTPYQDTIQSDNDLTLEGKNDGNVCWQASIGAGGAITALSESDDEYEEMLLKARAVKNAVQVWVDQIGASPKKS